MNELPSCSECNSRKLFSDKFGDRIAKYTGLCMSRWWWNETFAMICSMRREGENEQVWHDRPNVRRVERSAFEILRSVKTKPGLHSVRRTYATEMRKRIYASHARRGVYTPRVDLGAYTQTSTQYRLRTISGKWIYFICRVKACVYA